MRRRLSPAAKRFRQFIALSFMTLLCILGIWVKPVPAHRPHDVVTQVEISPNYDQDQTVLIIVRGNLYRSNNGGLAWQRIVQGLETSAPLTDLEVGQQEGQFVLLSTEGDGIYRSLDQGLSWQHSSNGLTELEIVSLAIAPGSSTVALAASQSGGIYRTDDGGDSWQQVLPGDEFIEAMGFSNNGEVAIAATARQILLSEDGGITWQTEARSASGLPLESPIMAIRTLENEKPNWLWLATRTNGIFQTSDRGQTWVQAVEPVVEEEIEDMQIQGNSQGEPQFFVSTAETGLFVWDGNVWQPRVQGLETDPQAQEFDDPNFTKLRLVATDQTSFLAGFDGLFRSENLGIQWQAIETLARGSIVALAVSDNYANDSTLAAVDYVGSIYISRDGGKSWEAQQNGLEMPYFTGNFRFVRPNYDPRRYFDVAISPDYSADEVLWATLLWTKLPFTQDDGTSWSITALPKEQRGLTIAASPNFARDELVYVLTQSGKVYQSNNRGRSFKEISQVPALQGNYGPSIAISPNFMNDQTLYVTGQEGIYKSIDQGKTWSSMTENIELAEAGQMQIAMSPNFAQDNTLFVVTNNKGLFISKNSGKSWDQKLGLPGIDTQGVPIIEAIAISPEYGTDQTLFISVRGSGLYKSTDEGNSFEQVTDAGLPLLRLNNVDSSGKPIIISPDYANDKTIFGFGSAQREIFKSTDSGLSWEISKLPDPPPANPQSVLGRLNLVFQIYRSRLQKLLLILIPLAVLMIIVYFTLKYLTHFSEG
jgi:photosystem II stability/assembly factor-like uncharacterized protein